MLKNNVIQVHCGGILECGLLMAVISFLCIVIVSMLLGLVLVLKVVALMFIEYVALILLQ